jgi:hypothetical protein
MGTVRETGKLCRRNCKKGRCKKVRQWCSTVGQFVSCDAMTRNVTTISTYYAAKVHAVLKRGKKKPKSVCLIHFNQHMCGVDK